MLCLSNQKQGAIRMVVGKQKKGVGTASRVVALLSQLLNVGGVWCAEVWERVGV